MNLSSRLVQQQLRLDPPVTQVKAMIPHLTESALTLELLRKDGLSLETPFGWGIMIATQERRFGLARHLAQARRNRRAMSTLPLSAPMSPPAVCASITSRTSSFTMRMMLDGLGSTIGTGWRR